LFGMQRDRAMFEKATHCFRSAIETDPGSADARAGLAQALLLDYQNRWTGTPDKSLRDADRLVRIAVTMDDGNAFAHYVAALSAMFHRDYERSEREASRALSINPNYAPAQNIAGIVHIYSGTPLKAVPYIERAMRLDPAFRQQY